MRNHCKLAKEFEARVESDTRFRVMNDVKVSIKPMMVLLIHLVQVGLVCFRLFGSNQLNQKLLSTINASGKLHMVTLIMLLAVKIIFNMFRCRPASMTILSSGSVSALSQPL